MGPDKEWQAKPSHARRAHRMNRDDEVESGENRGKSRNEYADRGERHVRVGVNTAVGSVKSPAGIDSARRRCRKREQTSNNIDIPAGEVQTRERQVPRSDHHGNQKISQHRGDRWNQKKENHRDAVHREQFVVSLGLYQISLGRQQLQSQQGGKNAPDKKDNSDGY